jgi:hypothetical protein
MNTLRAPVAITIAFLIAAAVGYVMFSPDDFHPDPAPPAGALPLAENLTLQSQESTSAPRREGGRPPGRADGGAPTAAGSPPSEETEPVVPVEPPATDRKAPYQPGPSKFRNATNPHARTLLARVGADFDAETFWLTVINDPATPAKERADLIEDLNEDGISDPARPTRNDLPLINGRIALIERLLPSAKDDVNAAAFREAHKDLVKMRDRLQE